MQYLVAFGLLAVFWGFFAFLLDRLLCFVSYLKTRRDKKNRRLF